MKSLTSFLAFMWLAIGYSYMITKGSYLYPGKISWWKDSWAPHPIELSQTNSGTADATVTVHFRPKTSLPTTGNLGYAIVTVPSTFSTTTTYTSSSMAIIANRDTSFSFTLSTDLPSAGVYGPFQIVTRTSANGQIYDANYLFAYVAVSASVSTPSSGSLAVDTVTLTSTSAVVGLSDGLYFTFEIPAGTNLWKHDIFEIVPDSRWTVTSSPTCASVDLSCTNNYIKGPKGDNSLPCAVAQSGGANGGYNTVKSTYDAENSIYIYGLSQDLIARINSCSLDSHSPYQIKLQVFSFILPLAAISSSNFSWNLKIWRWGTSNLLAQFTGTGPLTPVPGVVTIDSWIPYNTNLAPTDIPNNGNRFYIFTKLTFHAAHTIENGKIYIHFNDNADVYSGCWWFNYRDPNSCATQGKCYMNTYMHNVSCGLIGHSVVITLSNGATLSANSAISITLLTKLYPGAGINEIATYDATFSTIIDKCTSIYMWEFNPSNLNYVSMSNFQFFANDTNIMPPDGIFPIGKQIGGYDQYLMWYIKPATSWDITTILRVNLPFSRSGVQLLQSYISPSAQYSEAILTASGGKLESSFNAHNFYPGNPGSISIFFTSGNYPTTTQNPFFAFSFGNAGDRSIALPFVSSNVATFYECWAKATSSTSNSITEFSSYVFSVLTPQFDSSLTFNQLCYNNLGGIPIYANYHALNMDFDFGDTTNHYYLDVVFDDISPSDIWPDAIDGGQIPATSTTPGVTPKVTISALTATVTISGLGFVNSGESVKILLPNGSDTSTGYYTTQTFYYLVDGADPVNKMILYTGSSSGVTLWFPNNFATLEVTSPSSGDYFVGQASVTTIISAKDDTLLMQDINQGWIGIGIPAGFTSSSTKLTLGSASADIYSVSSQVVHL
ncbi:unnamed protein product [Blepharisma stoltei]|uniref:Uncharacterized protein n=1 Tax=Blepharisma stoltei TaxID=1481888 RepID=A0AAU9IH76_9CILI|nr:unnamed protein product [Blepharisma stoltei]